MSLSGNSFEASLTHQSPQSRRNPVSDTVNGSNDLRRVRAQCPRHGDESCNLPAQLAQLFGNAGAVYFPFSANLSLMRHVGIIDLGPVQPRATVNKPATMPEGQREMGRKSSYIVVPGKLVGTRPFLVLNQELQSGLVHTRPFMRSWIQELYSSCAASVTSKDFIFSLSCIPRS